MRSTHTSCVRKRFCPNCPRAFKLNKNGTSKCLDNHLRTCQPCVATIDEVAPTESPTMVVAVVPKPKRGWNAYIHFSMSHRAAPATLVATMRDELWRSCDQLTDNSVTKRVGIVSTLSKMWRGLSDEEKAPYKTMAAADKLRYQTEMKTYLTSTTAEPKKKIKKVMKTNSPIGPIKKSSYVGVHWHRGAKKWRASYKGTYLGIFENEGDAATEVEDYMML